MQLWSCVCFHSSLKKEELREAKSFAQTCARVCAINMTQDFGPPLENVGARVFKKTFRLQIFSDFFLFSSLLSNLQVPHGQSVLLPRGSGCGVVCN